MSHSIAPDSIHVAPLTLKDAEDIAAWRYRAPYDVYDMVGVSPDELLDPEAGFHAVMAGGTLIGFRSFGSDGQVPGWDYAESALDTGGGLRPEFTGQGLGRAVISAGLEFGRAWLTVPSSDVEVVDLGPPQSPKRAHIDHFRQESSFERT